MICRIHAYRRHTWNATVPLLFAALAGVPALAAEPLEQVATAEGASEARKGGATTEVVRETAMVQEEDETEVENDPASSATKVVKKPKDTAERNRASASAKNDLFRPDPSYQSKYAHEEQVEIYGGKFAVDPPRPPIEIGRQQYTSGTCLSP